MITQLNSRETHELLSKQRLGRLGCSLDGEPYVVPVNYLMVEESIYMHSLPGHKINVLRANPRVCLQVDDIKDEFNWRSVIATGAYEELTDPEERERMLNRLLQRQPNLTPVESAMRPGEDKLILFRIRVDRITGLAEHW